MIQISKIESSIEISLRSSGYFIIYCFVKFKVIQNSCIGFGLFLKIFNEIAFSDQNILPVIKI